MLGTDPAPRPPLRTLRRLAIGVAVVLSYAPVAWAQGGPPNEPRPRLVLDVGPSTPPSAVAITPNGRVWATVEDRSVSVWDAGSAQVLRRIQGHSEAIQSIAADAAGRHVVTGAFDGTARVWDVRTGEERAAADFPRGQRQMGVVLAVATGPDHGVALVAGSDHAWGIVGMGVIEARGNGYATLWDWRQDHVRARLEGHEHPVRAAAISPDGLFALTGDDGGVVRLWVLESGVEVGRLAEHAGPVQSVSFSPDGQLALTASEDGTAHVVDVWSGEERVRIDGLGDDLGSATFSLDGQMVVTAGRGGVHGWDVETGQEIWRQETEASQAVVSPDGESVLAALAGRSPASQRMWEMAVEHARPLAGVTERPEEALQVLDATTGEPVLSQPVTKARIAEVSTALASPVVATVHHDPSSVAHRTVNVWDIRRGAEVQRLGPGGLGASRVALHPTGTRLVTAGEYPAALMWGMSGRGQLWADLPLPHGQTELERVRAAAFSADGNQILTGSADMTARVWDAQGSEVRRLDVGSEVWAVAFSNDGRFAATGSQDRLARVWDLETGEELARLEGHAARVRSVEFSPDGQHLLTSSRDSTARGDAWSSTARVWDWAEGEEIAQIRPEGEVVLAATFSPDGQLVLVTGYDIADFSGTASVWDWRRGDRRVDFVGHADRVGSGVFLPGGEWVLTGSDDLTTRVWHAETGEEAARLVSLLDGSWLVVTPDGRFDAPDLERISGAVWVAPDDPLTPLPIEAFMREYYEPRLLPRVLAGEAFRDVGSILEKNRVQPRVEIAATMATDRTARVTVRATGTERTYGGETRTSGVRDLRLFRDGQLVGWADGLRVPETGAWDSTFTVPLPSGFSAADTVRFSAYAFNRDLVKSPTARADLSVPASGAPRDRRAFVVSLGVDVFADPSWNLSFAAADAQATVAALDSTLAAAPAYDEVVAVALVSDGATDHATADALRGALLRLAGEPLDAQAEAALRAVPGADRLSQATPDDIVVLTASTHGYASPEGVFYLFPSDIPARNGGLSDPALLQAAVSSDELSAWLRGVDAGALAVVVDACNAAGAVEGNGFKPGPMGARGLGQLAFDKGAAVLTATQADAPALEASTTGRGLLTFALVENGLLAGMADGALAGGSPRLGTEAGELDGTITLAEWLAYGAARVPELYEEIRAGAVETYGQRGVAAFAERLPPDVEAEDGGSGAQTPELFDFRRTGRAVVVADE